MVPCKYGARDLVDRIALGSRAAEDDLVAAYYAPLLSRLRKKVPSLATAEDICQESFIIAIRRLRRGDIRDPASVRAFLAGIGERLILVHARVNRIALALTDFDADALEAREPLPLDVLERASEGAVVRKAVSELRCPRDRELLVRRYWLDQNGPEIQQRLALTPGVFKKAISRARSRVRHLLTCETPCDQRR